MFDFIKRLFKKEESESPEPIKEEEIIPETEPVKEESLLASLWTKFSDGKYDEVIKEADIIIEQNEALTKNEALKLKGLSYFRQEKYDVSEKLFTELSAESTNPSDWFNLLTSAALNRSFELSDKALEKTIEYYSEYGTENDLPIPQVFYYYMLALRDVKEYNKAFVQFEKLKDIYCKLAITDATFLYIRGVPFLRILSATERKYWSISIKMRHKSSWQNSTAGWMRRERII
ncbi:MAG: hypothetical protein M0D53_00470 [Flavobacterium sp. JAD_PAG50586_2]|nr:MAG: hypothetical protein M0D53_00470 [Flavobacterium sp. JAD_PAG50586_2]